MPGDLLQVCIQHGRSGSWYMDIGFVFEQVDQHAAAIEALFPRHAAPQVRDAQQGVGAVDDLFDVQW